MGQFPVCFICAVYFQVLSIDYDAFAFLVLLLTKTIGRRLVNEIPHLVY